MTYDNADRRSTLTYPNGIVATYGYDNANQLTSLAYASNSNPVGDLTYTYDLAGERISVGGSWARIGLPQALASATYDAGNRLLTRGSQVFSYDANGNLGSNGPTSYTWNTRDQLSALSGDISASFQYDGAGRRRGKTISGATTQFFYDRLNMVQELATGGTPTANLLSGPKIDETFWRSDGSGSNALLVDALGSTLELANVSGVVQTHYSYEPFGSTTISGNSSTNSIQFTGRENDQTGLYAFRARYYDSTEQRFVAEDPLISIAASIQMTFPDTRNAIIIGQAGDGYSYANNNPLSFVDPLGLAAEGDCRRRAIRLFGKCLLGLLGSWSVVDFASTAACALTGPAALECIMAVDGPQTIAMGIHFGVGLPTCYAVYEIEYRRCKGCSK